MKNIFLFLLFLLSSFTILCAAELPVQISDRDLEIPLEGALLQILGQEATFYSDSEGSALVEYPDELQRIVLLVHYPGYDSQRMTISSKDALVQVKMTISGMIEGEELVVERKIIGKSDEEVGISVVMDKEDMDVTANLGIVEDVMNSVKTLPGVGYTSGWDAQPSIRGGYPDEMAATMDGFYVTYPFHWGGAYSIFNPNMVESVKLSHGVYSARYGRAMSGLLEITTITADEPELRIDGSLSTTSTDLFIQSPIGKKGGLFAGGKVTYLDTAKLLYPDETEAITTMPYIRDFYTKMSYRPGSSVGLYMSGFYGTDGVGMDSNFESETYSTDVLFDYDYTNAFLAGGMDWSPGEKLYIDVLGGYNWNLMDMTFKAVNKGTMTYSEEFLQQYGDSFGLSEGDTYSIDGLENSGTGSTDMQQGQLKLTVERLMSPTDILAVGTETVVTTTSESDDLELWVPVDNESGLGLKQYNFQTDVDGNHSLNSAGFMVWEHGSENSLLKSELGVRGEYYTIWNEDFTMHARPLINPRGSVTYNLLKDSKHLDAVNLTIGSGLFSSMPLEAELSEKKYGIADWEMSPDRALFNLAGIEVHWNDKWKFKFETYYKYYLNRMVLSSDDATGDSLIHYNTDGKGHTAGFDFMVQKKIARKWDGYISYSFIWARFYNPSNTGTESETLLTSNEPLDQWYYPYYHRFHNLNMVINWRFQPGWTFSVIGQLATGAPRDKVGDVTVYPVEYEGQVIEQYGRASSYSDSLRDGVSAPVDIRLSYAHYPENSRVQWEWYIAVEDILTQIYKPSTNSDYNEITGEENSDTSADFDIGIPLPSFGLKVSY
ncbi:TonB-dependent receptor [Oceanispirochaeta sp.]|uniref:TonB-dependent receptor plug domain-containing protein n=1 Tax=Oceanispirochaeta sp. TaxID=2035350 RepID=UPI0026039C02|nr:TonB-dependent receptor [Oceanispirochaeta sp.]MDA3956558.1 TonB-dependent receptor [Oceanispirochaeta sp.]